MFMTCCGNLGKDNNIIYSLNETFANEVSGARYERVSQSTILTNRNFVICDGVIQDPGNSGTVLLNFPMCGYTHIDKYPLHLYSYILTKGISSALFKLLRNDHGIVYTIDSSSDIFYRRFGLFTISFSTNSENIFQALELIFDFLTEDINETQLTKAKILFIQEYYLSREDNINKCEQYGFNMLYDSPIITGNKIENIINSVTTEHVNRIKQQYIDITKLILIHFSEINTDEFDKFLINYK
jgi:predicted Zn-dependent peptidase